MSANENPNRLLSLETGFPTYSIALIESAPEAQPVIRAEYLSPIQRKASTYLHYDIQTLLKEVGWTVGELTGICVSTGPGGFTGLRVGIATAKGIARAAGLPLYSGDALDGLAAGLELSGASAAIPMIDVRRGEVTARVYAVESGRLGPVLLDTKTGAPGGLAEAIAEKMGAQPLLIGTGATLYAEKWSELLGERIRILERPAYPTAGAIGRLLWGEEGGIRAKSTSPEALGPQYARSEGREFKKTAR